MSFPFSYSLKTLENAGFLMFSGSIEKKKDLFTLNIQHIDALLPLVTVNIRLTINKIYDINSKNNPSPFI